MSQSTIGQQQPVVFSLGGSLIAPASGIDVHFLSQFRTFITKQIAHGKTFIIVTGGGTTSRTYQKALREALKEEVDPIQLDWLGIHAIRLNAELLYNLFIGTAYPEVVVNFEAKVAETQAYPLLIAGAEAPGHSSDYDAVKLATLYRSTLVINLTNTDRIYTADPNVDPTAEAIDRMSWNQVIDVVGEEWHPGMHVPFDPVAAVHARDNQLSVICCNGKDLDNLSDILAGNPFTGTTIE